MKEEEENDDDNEREFTKIPDKLKVPRNLQ